MNRFSLFASAGALAAALLLSSCGPTKQDFGSLEPGGSTASPNRSDLELPPDLVDGTSDRIVSARAAEEEPGQLVLPEIDNLEIERNDEQGWIEVNADADIVWRRLVSHWDSLGVELVHSDPTVGIMETDWVNATEPGERRSPIGGTFGSVLGDLMNNLFDQATSLDKYTLQLERRGEDRTRINVSHKGLKKIQTQEPTKQHNEEFEWVETEEQPDKIRRALTSIAYGLNSSRS